MSNRVSSFAHTICIKHFYRLCCLMCVVSSAPQRDIMMDMSRGIISSFMSSPFTLTAPPSCLNASLLDLCWRLHAEATAIDTVDTDYMAWTNGSDFITRTMTDLKTKSDLRAVWTDAFSWRELRGFESRPTSPAEVRHSGHVSPWWRKPNDAGQLSAEETLRLCVRVLQMKAPKKQGSELSWSGFYTRVWN